MDLKYVQEPTKPIYTLAFSDTLRNTYMYE